MDIRRIDQCIGPLEGAFWQYSVYRKGSWMILVRAAIRDGIAIYLTSEELAYARLQTNEDAEPIAEKFWGNLWAFTRPETFRVIQMEEAEIERRGLLDDADAPLVEFESHTDDEYDVALGLELQKFLETKSN